jgi:cob(I)alamin adenosyltransferase
MDMPIYTRGGDRGETSLFNGTRVPKDSFRVEAYGAVDELNAVLGMARTRSKGRLTELIIELQRDLFKVGAELASPGERSDAIPRVAGGRIKELESYIDECMEGLPPLRRFILPGGGEAASTLHLARTVCRRAERKVVTLSGLEEVREEVKKYMNRLSDLLYAMSRLANRLDGVEEVQWRGREEEPSS